MTMTENINVMSILCSDIEHAHLSTFDQRSDENLQSDLKFDIQNKRSKILTSLNLIIEEIIHQRFVDNKTTSLILNLLINITSEPLLGEKMLKETCILRCISHLINNSETHVKILADICDLAANLHSKKELNINLPNKTVILFLRAAEISLGTENDSC